MKTTKVEIGAKSKDKGGEVVYWGEESNSCQNDEVRESRVRKQWEVIEDDLQKR